MRIVKATAKQYNAAVNRNISDLFFGPKFFQENFDLEIPSAEFVDIDLKGNVRIKGYFLRSDEGIMVYYKSLKFIQKSNCVRCGKELALPREVKNVEWTYHENAPEKFDDFFELLLIDRKKMEINLNESLRQEILLNYDFNAHCKEACYKEKKEKIEKKPGVKALAGLKDMWKA